MPSTMSYCIMGLVGERIETITAFRYEKPHIATEDFYCILKSPVVY